VGSGHPLESFFASAPQGEEESHLLHAIGVVGVEFESALELTLRLFVLTLKEQNHSEHAMAAALLRVEINRMRRSLKRRFENRARRRGIVSESHLHEREISVGQGVLRIQGDSPLEQLASPSVVIVTVAPEVGEAPQDQIVCGRIVSLLVTGFFETCVLYPPEQRCCNRLGDIVLDGEEVIKCLVVTLSQ
jgi:hypothetical protein